MTYYNSGLSERRRLLPVPRWRSVGVWFLSAATALSSAYAQTPAGQPATSTSAARSGRLPLAPLRPLRFTVDEGTLMSVDVSPDGTRLAFDLLGQIFTLPITGGRARQLTTGPAFAERPMFARDGRHLLFWSDRDGARALWRVPVTDGRPAPVRPADTAGLSVSLLHSPEGLAPDTLQAPGDRYSMRLPGARQDVLPGVDFVCLEEHFEILERATGQSRRVARQPAECWSPSDDAASRPSSAFTPDGEAFITSYGGKLRRVDLATGTVRVIPFTARVTLQIRPLVRFPHQLATDSLVHARHIEQPRVAPDGRRVAFSAFDRVWQRTLPRGTPRRLTRFDRIETDPVWSPDGQFVAFATWSDSGGGDGALYRVRADGTSLPERLTREIGRYRYSQLTYTADGQRLVAVRQPATSAIIPTGRGTDSLDLVWLPAAGGVATAMPLPDDVCKTDLFNRTPRHGLALLPDRPDAVQLITTQRVFAFPLGTDISGSRADTAAAPLLDLSTSSADGTGSAETGSCPLLAPTGDRALVYRDDDLYLVAVPQVAAKTGNPAADISTGRAADREPRLPALRHIALPFASPLGGPESPNWAPDGRSFTFSYGRTLYHYDLARADSLLGDSVARAGTARAVRGPAYQPSEVVLDAALPRDRPPRGTLVFRHARLITMQGNRVIERGDLVVRDGRIAALGPSGTVAIPRGAHVIEAAGRTILPGLVDLHNHLTHRGLRESKIHLRYPQYEATLAFGVLTSRDPQTTFLDFMTLEDKQAAGQLLGPRVRNAGPGFGNPFHLALTSLADARAALRPYIEVYRSEYLKEHSLSQRDQREWLAMAAAERGLNVVSHGHGTSHLVQDAIDGYGGFDHRAYVLPLYADMRQLLARTGITLSHHSLGTTPFSLPRPYFFTLLDTTAASLVRRWSMPWDSAFSNPPLSAKSDRAAWAAHWAADSVTAQLAAAGARIAVASHGEFPGYVTHMYLWALVEGGMPPLEALRSGTLRGAEALGLDRELGSLEVGKRAHLLVVNGNPLEHIQQTMSIYAVLFNGHLYDPATLDELWPRPLARGPGWWQLTAPGRPAAP